MIVLRLLANIFLNRLDCKESSYIIIESEKGSLKTFSWSIVILIKDWERRNINEYTQPYDDFSLRYDDILPILHAEFESELISFRGYARWRR